MIQFRRGQVATATGLQCLLGHGFGHDFHHHSHHHFHTHFHAPFPSLPPALQCPQRRPGLARGRLGHDCAGPVRSQPIQGNTEGPSRSTPIRLVRANQKQPTSCETAAGRNENTQKLLISGIPSIPSDHTCEAHQSHSSRGRFFVSPESQGRKKHVRERPSISTHFSFCSAPTLTPCLG